MCGIAGLIKLSEYGTPEKTKAVISEMLSAIPHRGPDSSGIWTAADGSLGLGHNRLSIVDLSVAGNQPMASTSGRYVISYNGEVYNHQELRNSLRAEGAAPVWKGHSDTETLLAAIEHWGIESTLERCVGMFAIALWDKQEETLSLIRDRVGEKPLYYGWIGDGSDAYFIFSSELKALRTHPSFRNAVCRSALTQYLRFLYVPAPRSIYEGIYKLEPGCLLSIKNAPPISSPGQPPRPGDSYGTLSIVRWWSLKQHVERGSAQGLNNESEALELLESTLQESIRLQSLADVPLGAFLSGGVDSSIIVALMQKQAKEAGQSPVNTFTIGFNEADFDESSHARKVANHLGTRHHEMRVTAQMAQDVISQLPTMYDEPFADASQIPTHLVCKSAKQYVTVALSGDAGDELFGGYNRYFWAPRVWNKFAGLPSGLRHALGSSLSSISVNVWNAIQSPFVATDSHAQKLGDKLHKLSSRLKSVDSLDDLYRSLVSEWDAPELIVKGKDGGHVSEPRSLLDDPLPSAGIEINPLPMMYQDTLTYLPDDILCKVDRASMACSLETRIPFLDHRVVELAWKIPLKMKVKGDCGRWILREILYKYVPKELIERPKMGFGVPVGAWLRGPLREWAENLLSESRLVSEGFFHPAPIRQAWLEHINLQRDHTLKLWAVLMFESWLEAQALPTKIHTTPNTQLSVHSN